MGQWFRLPRAPSRPAILLLVPLGLACHPCESCHPKEVAGYSHSSMARSLRRSGTEPEGAFTAAVSGTRFAIRSGTKGTWQRMERAGEVSEYRVEYVIGSGSHAAGYLIRIGDHLFQSPVCYYTNRRAYDLAPGFERVSEPDFTRPVGEECVLCHSGRPLHVSGTVNRYDAVLSILAVVFKCKVGLHPIATWRYVEPYGLCKCTRRAISFGRGVLVGKGV